MSLMCLLKENTYISEIYIYIPLSNFFQGTSKQFKKVVKTFTQSFRSIKAQ